MDSAPAGVLAFSSQATGRAVASFEMPDEDVSWAGLVFDDASNMYLLGDEREEQQFCIGQGPHIRAIEHHAPANV